MTFDEWYNANCSEGWWYGTVDESPSYEECLRIWEAAQAQLLEKIQRLQEEFVNYRYKVEHPDA